MLNHCKYGSYDSSEAQKTRVKKFVILFLFIFIAVYVLMNRSDVVFRKNPDAVTGTAKAQVLSSKSHEATEDFKNEPRYETTVSETVQMTTSPIQKNVRHESGKKSDEENLLTYEIDDGFAVIHGDLIIGEVSDNQHLKSLSGKVSEPALRTWPTNEIPVYIQPNLQNRERVHEALAYFTGTNVSFVPYVNQEDALVFENGNGNCKSYLGYIGGKQPIYLSEGCSAQAVAHEIMHALGFVHEQNRVDRDNYIDIVWSNIEPKSGLNFEKFSSSMMQVSGLSKFDFESIMIYPQTMFSVNGQVTMKSKVDGQTISPRQSLSSKDVERINKIY